MKIWNGKEWTETPDDLVKLTNARNKINTNLETKEDIELVNKNSNAILNDKLKSSKGDNILSRLGKAGSTMGDLATNVGKGLLNRVEGVVDLGRYGVANVADFLGADDYANDVRERAKQNTTDLLLGGVNNYFNKNSMLKENGIIENIAQGIGGIGADIGLGGILPTPVKSIKIKKFNVPTTAILSSAGSGMTEAYNNGASNGQALAYGAMSGLSEGFSEALFSGLGNTFSKQFGGGALDDVLVDKLTNKISNKTIQTIAKNGLKATGEGVEEIISGLGNAFAKKLTYMNNEDISKLIEDENLLNSFVVGTLTSAVMQTPSTISSIKNNSQKSLPRVNNTQTLNNLTNNSTNLNENTLNNINIPTSQNNVTNDLNIENNIIDPNSDLSDYKTPYHYLVTNNEKSNKMKQSATKYFNNSQNTINLISTIDKVIKDKNYNILFDNTITNQDGQSINAQIKSLDNGEVEIRLNPNSSKSGEFLIMHEVTHAIETESMKQLVLDYANKHNDFNEALENLKQTYGTNDVSSEVLADISGQLFGNQEFINNLSMKEPNVFKKIYNKIIELANKITGNSKESLFIKDLKNKWEIAYRNTTTEQSVNNLSKDTLYSSQTLKDGTQYVKTETGLFTKDDGTPMTQREIYNSLIGKEITFDDGIKATIVNRLPSKDMYNELFKRLPRYQDVKNVKKVNNTINENVVELLENSKNISPNEPDYMNRHQKQGISSFDTRNVSFYDGENAYDLDFSIAKLQDGNYVAYAKRNLSSNNNLLNKIKKEMPRSKSSLTSLSNNTISQSNNNVKSEVSTKYSMQENANNTQELDNSSFYLINSNGKKIDISNLKETSYMKQFTFNRRYKKDNITTYRGVGEEGGTGIAMYGLGLYTTLDKKYASQYGKVYIVDNSLLPNNPLHFKTQNDFKIWEQEIAKQLDIKRNELYGDYGVEQYLNKLGYDGLMIGTGKDTDLISFTNSAIKYSQDSNRWHEYLDKNYKPTGTSTDMKKISALPKYSDVKSNDNEQIGKLPTAKIPQDPTKESSYDNEKRKTRKEVQRELQSEMGITEDDLQIGKDISSIEYQRTDPIRLNEKVFGAEIGKKINDATINKTKHNEAERIRFLNQERDVIKKLGIKPRSKESAAVQKYGEKQYITDKGTIINYGDIQLASEFSDVNTQNKIKRAAQIIRNKYDKYIDDINSVITELGYDEIPKRKDYMRHFQELNDKLTQWGLPINRQTLSQDALPTDINGITDQFKPGKNWFASAMQRKGLKTTYDAITGIEGYLESASNLMYHTGDIQRYRALSKLVRDTFGQAHGLDNVDLSTEKGQQRLNDIYDNKLSKYAAWLDEQANALAGKKGAIDRGAERVVGRKIYSILDAAKKQVGSNMTGFNIRSALTNFASAVQGASKTNKLAFLKGTISTVKNIVHNDGLIDKSDFLTSRLKNDSQLSKKILQKASNAGQILMTGSDYFTSNQIWRSKYYENLSKGMSESQAIKNADDFASRIMGDRSKGATAEVFNSKTLGLLTQFQLEVNNQWSSLIHDNKIDVKNGNKSGATVLFQMGQLAAMSYMFNNFMKSLTGSGVMLDPIDILKKIFNPDDDDKTLEERAEETLGEIIDQIPMASIFTGGGRIPITEAFTGSGTFLKKITGQTDNYGNKIKWSDVKDDVIESAFYWLLPTGYGQIKKTAKGVSMYSGKLPTAGSYTNSGNLRFTADKTPAGITKAFLFGQYSSKEAQDYIDSGYKAISKNKIQEMKDLNMTSSEYKKFSKEMTDATKTTDSNNYKLYTDGENNYWYDESNGKVYDSNYRESSKTIQSLKKVSSKQLKFDYINSLNLNNEMKNKILNSNYGGNVTDSYGYTKYVKKGEYIYSSDGLQKYKNESGTVYWINKKTGAIYNSSGKLAKKVNKSKLSPVTQDLTYWYDDKNNQLYDSDYNKVDNSIISSLDKETKDIDINVYNNYSSYDEYKFATDNPKEYSLINNFSIDYNKFNDIKSEVNDIKSNSSSINKKENVFKYINSLNYNKVQKMMLYKTLGNYSIKNYKKEMYEYIEGLKISKEEKETIWNQLYGGE